MAVTVISIRLNFDDVQGHSNLRMHLPSAQSRDWDTEQLEGGLSYIKSKC